MRKNTGLLVLCISVLAFVTLIGSGMLSTSYAECISDEASCQEVIRTRMEYEGLLTNLCFDEQDLFYEYNTKTFYYSLVEGSSSAYNPQVKVGSDTDTVNVLFLEEITEGGIEQNQTIPILAYSDEYYYKYNLKCTTLPLMNINVRDSILREEVPMDMTLFDNQKGAANRVTNSTGTIKVRGASSSRLLKTSYRMSLTMESLGENTRPNHVSLLGMRQDEDWILYTPFNDQEKVRNVFNTNLWTQTCGRNNTEGIQTGIEYKYFELFINGDYMGLYALGYPIDGKLMGIDEAKGEALYKKVGWGSETAFEPGYSSTDGAVINGFEVKTVDETNPDSIYEKWDMLLAYYNQFYEYRYDNEKLLEMIDINNAIDTYLFLGLIQGHDNTRGSEVRNMYLYMYDNAGTISMLYAPWDMDLTWGNFFSEDWYANYVQTYYLTPRDNLVMKAGPLNQLLVNKADGVREQIVRRYRELRETSWSDEAIKELLENYEADIYDSGAFRRELARWPEGTANHPDEKLSVFKEYVAERFTVLDAYYADFEENMRVGNDYTFSVTTAGCEDVKLYWIMQNYSN